MLDFMEKLQDDLENKKMQDKLGSDREKYYDLRDRVKIIIGNLKYSLDELNLVSNKVIDGYSVNGESGDDGFLNNTREEIKNTYNYLTYTVLPDIEKKIKELTGEIEKVDLGG